jgi:hypothetical protein
MRIDEVCLRFEAAWQEGYTPRLEDYLGDAAGEERAALLRQLLRVELEFRGHGRVPAVEDYLDRFPGHELLIREEFERRASQDAAPPEPKEIMDTGAGEGGMKTTPHVVKPHVVNSDCASAVPGYEVRGWLGTGGMAEVLLVHDPDFDRPLALKVMLPELCHHADSESRFMEEARIMGRLQHPGIPPVHELGRLDDGRPFLTMKLIDGDTLDELLKQRSILAFELPRFVTIFAQICQTVSYAHSRGVIHRDLKPRNIMVGAFGEVQVMDWGLAKERRTQDPGYATGEAPMLKPGVTAPGTLLGTPAFMAPEQARGESARVDKRADVFGLGAILCVILTGKPPFVAGGVNAVLSVSASGELGDAFARLDACGADVELVALARRCLAPDLEQRPDDAVEVADAVVAYQAGVEERARLAAVERAAAEARAEEATARVAAERRARWMTLGLVTVVLLILAAGGFVSCVAISLSRGGGKPGWPANPTLPPTGGQSPAFPPAPPTTWPVR